MTVKGNLRHNGDIIVVKVPATRTLEVNEEITVLNVSGTHTGEVTVKCEGENVDYEFDTSDLLTTGKLRVKSITSGISEKMKVNSEKAPFYDLQGRRIDQPQKGVHIIGGKKIIRK